MNNVEVCLTPALIHQYDLSGKIAVVVDIFRATSCMVAGMGSHVKAIYPVAEVDQCFELAGDDKIKAGERGGIKIEGFDIGNSPFEYMSDITKDQEVVVTTTNGTQAIAKSTDAKEILIGAFLNISALADYLSKSENDIVIHCAGWKGAVNMEDSLFAGALIQALNKSHRAEGDSALLAQALYCQHQEDLMSAAQASSHAKRLSKFGVEKDLEFCMKKDQFEIIPIYESGMISIL